MEARYPLVLLFFLLNWIPVWSSTYDKPLLVDAPLELIHVLDDFFSKKSMNSLLNSRIGFNSLGINKIYLDKSNIKFITFKFDVKSDFKINEIAKVSKGYVLHIKSRDKVLGFYFSGFSINETNYYKRSLLELMSHKNSSRFSFSLFPQAYANCEEGALDKESENFMSTTGASILGTSLLGCLKGTGSGIVDYVVSVPNLIVDGIGFIADESLAWFSSPKVKAEQYYNAIESGVKGLKNFSYAIGMLQVNPSLGAELLVQLLGPAGKIISDMFVEISKLPIEVATELICANVVAIGLDAFVTAFSGGAALAKLAVTLSKISQKVVRISRAFLKLNAEKFKSLSQVGFDKMSQIKFFKAIEQGTLSDKVFDRFEAGLLTESPLAQSLAIKGLKCAL